MIFKDLAVFTQPPEALGEPAIDGSEKIAGLLPLALIAGERGPVANIGKLRAPGFRYLTVQVWDCIAEHAGVLARGGTEGRPPTVLGDRVRYSFVLDR